MTQTVDPAQVKRWRGKIEKRFESSRELLIPILQDVQSEEGYLPPEAVEAVARHLRMPTSKIYGVASFYAQFHFEPRGLNTVTVCRGTACHVRGSARILRDLEKNLDIEPGATTDDQIFSLQTVACFGACARAPVVVVNEKVHGQQTSVAAKKIIDGVRSTSKKNTPESSSRSKPKTTPKTKTKRPSAKQRTKKPRRVSS